MSERVDALLDELARRLARGDDLDLAGLLEQAGDEADVLAGLADRLLATAPRRTPTDADRAFVAALAEPPLLRLRLARRMKVAAVSEMLARWLALEDVPRLERYYQRLEGGLLDPRRVDPRVWDALERALGAPARALALAWQRPSAPEVAYHRMQDSAAVLAEAEPPPAIVVHADPPPADRDELDRLFLGPA